MALPPSRTRLLALYKTTSEIFATTFNPEGLRTGNKILRQRLKGQDLLDYYPRRAVTVRDMRRLWGNQIPDEVKALGGQKWFFPDEDETIRFLNVEKAKARGKGAPAKKKEKAGAGGRKRK